MNAKIEQGRSSVSELAAGAVAIVAVALITFLGVRTTPLGEAPPAPPSSDAPRLEVARSEATRSIAPEQDDASRRPALVEPNRAEPSRAEPSRAEPSRVEPSRAEPSQAPEVTGSSADAKPTGLASAPSSPPADPSTSTPAPPLPSLDPAIQYSPAPLTRTNPLEAEGAGSSSSAAPEASRRDPATRARPASQTATAAIPSPGETERDPLNRAHAMLIQSKLHELGYYFGDGDGAWGPVVRKALRDFKTANGLQENEQWDRETEERLWSARAVRAATFIGVWAREAAECRHHEGDDQRIRIDSHGAEVTGGKCEFRSVKLEAASRWRVLAVCSAARNSWTAHISLRLVGSNLRWSSERGTETYVRCPPRGTVMSSQ